MYDLLIIGSGPAGLGAAIYGERAGLRLAVIDRSPISGGQVLTTYEVDNYLGMPEISGSDISERFREHADKLGVEFIMADVKTIEDLGATKTVHTDEGDFEAKAVILATGATHAMLGVEGEMKLAGMGVSYCATCDGAFFRGRTVAVVGGGDVAVRGGVVVHDSVGFHILDVHFQGSLGFLAQGEAVSLGGVVDGVHVLGVGGGLVQEVICPGLALGLAVELLIQGLGGVQTEHGDVVAHLGHILVDGVNIVVVQLCGADLGAADGQGRGAAGDDAAGGDTADDDDQDHHRNGDGEQAGVQAELLGFLLLLQLLFGHSGCTLLLAELLLAGCAHVINSSHCLVDAAPGI